MKRYRTTYGSYAVILGLGPVAIALPTVNSWMLGNWPMFGVGVVVIGVFAWTLLGTGYGFDGGFLVVRLGPFRKRIPLGEITRFDLHRMRHGPMFGLGSEFIGIEYRGKGINVSPKDGEGFVEALCGRTGLRPGQARTLPASNCNVAA